MKIVSLFIYILCTILVVFLYIQFINSSFRNIQSVKEIRISFRFPEESETYYEIVKAQNDIITLMKLLEKGSGRRFFRIPYKDNELFKSKGAVILFILDDKRIVFGLSDKFARKNGSVFCVKTNKNLIDSIFEFTRNLGKEEEP